MPEVSKEPTREYKVTGGSIGFRDPNSTNPRDIIKAHVGETIQLTDSQAHSFAGQVELMEAVRAQEEATGQSATKVIKRGAAVAQPVLPAGQ